MKQILTILLFSVLSLPMLHAQKIKLKDNQVLLDGKAILGFERLRAGNDMLVKKLGTEETLISFQRHDNETRSYPQDDYYKIYFPETKQLIESANLNGWPYAKVLEMLVKQKALNPDGTLNPEKVDDFVQQYDENITNRTLR